VAQSFYRSAQPGTDLLPAKVESESLPAGIRRVRAPREGHAAVLLFGREAAKI